MASLKEKIRKSTKTLTETVRYSDIRDYLRQELFESHHDEEIMDSKIQRVQMRTCLDLLPTQGPNAYQIFMDALQGPYPWVVEEINSAQGTIPGGHRAQQTATQNLRDDLKKKTISGGEITKTTIIRLSKHPEVMDSWQTLGRTLGVSEADLKQVRYANRDDLKECIYQMMATWHGQQTKANATNEVVYQALLNAELFGAARDLFL